MPEFSPDQQRRVDALAVARELLDPPQPHSVFSPASRSLRAFELVVVARYIETGRIPGGLVEDDDDADPDDDREPGGGENGDPEGDLGHGHWVTDEGPDPEDEEPDEQWLRHNRARHGDPDGGDDPDRGGGGGDPDRGDEEDTQVLPRVQR